MKIEKTPNGNLTFVADPEDMEMLRDLKARTGENDLQFMDELLEETGWSGNSVLMSIRPEDVGGLTEAPIVTDGLTIENNGDVAVNGSVWWFPNYMVENFADTLIEKGRVTFALADEVLEIARAPEKATQATTLRDEGANRAFDDRVEALPRLQQQAGAAYTLYLVASKAIQDAFGDANTVDWGQVHQDVFAKAVGQDKQLADKVFDAIKLHSPGAITPAQIAAVEAMGGSGKLTAQTMKPGEWGTKDGKPAITWWRHGQAAKGEPSIVTEVCTYATEVERVDAASPSARDSTAATLVQLAASLGKWAAVKNDSVDAKLREFNEAFDVEDLRLTAVELAQKVFLQNPEHDGSKKISLPPAFLEDMSRILAPSQMKSRDDGPAP